MANPEKLHDSHYDLISALGSVFPYPDYTSSTDKHTKGRWDRVFSEIEKVLSSGGTQVEPGSLRDEVSWASPNRGRTSTQGRIILVAIGVLLIAGTLWAWHDRAMLKSRQHGHSDVYAAICSKIPGVAPRLLPVDENGVSSTCAEFENYFDDPP